jgi:hypothetical protein
LAKETNSMDDNRLTASLQSGLHTERHYTPAELGELWGLSSETIRRLLDRESCRLGKEPRRANNIPRNRFHDQRSGKDADQSEPDSDRPRMGSELSHLRYRLASVRCSPSI